MKKSDTAYKFSTLTNENFNILNTFYDSIPDPLFTIDNDFNYLSFNSAHSIFMKEFYGIDIEIGANFIEPIPDSDERIKLISIFKRVLDGEQFSITEEFGQKNHESKTYQVSLKSVCINSDLIVGITGIYRQFSDKTFEKTENDRLTNLFSQAFSSSPTPMTIASQNDGRYIEVNDSFLKMVGLSKGEVIGKTGNELNLIDTEARNKILEHLKATGNIKNVEINAKTKSGNELILLTSIENTQLAGQPCTLATMIDITEKKQFESKLEVSNQEHKAIIETAMDGFWMIDRNGKILEVNKSYSEMIGYSIPELLTMSILDIEAVENSESIHHVINRVLANGSVRFESKHRKKDGTLIDVEVSIQIQNKINGNVVSFFHDITERKKAEYALQLERNKLVAAFQNQSMGFVLSDVDGTDISMNETALRLHDFETHDELFKNVSEYENDWELSYPDGKPIPYSEWPLVKATRGEFVRNFEINYHNKISGKKWICDLTSVPVRNESGEIVHIVQTLLDITERKNAEISLKESEEKFRNVFEYSMLGKSMTMMDGKMILNKAFCNILGYSAVELETLKWDEITYPDDIQNDTLIINSLVAGERKSARWEKRYLHKNGEIIWVDINTTLMCDKNNVPIYFITSINDITSRKLAEKKLQLSEYRYRSFFERNFSVILILNPDTAAITDANPAACNFYGWSYEEIITKKITDINTLSDEGAFDRMRTAKKEGRMRYLFQHKKANGELCDVEVYSTAIEIEGVISLYVIIHDVTERTKAEEALKTNRAKLEVALASMTDAVFISDKNGVFLQFNDAFATFHKFIDKNDCARTFDKYPDFLEVYLPDGSLAPVEMWAVPRALKGETVTNAEYILKRKDSGETWIGSYSFSPIRDENKEIVGSVVVARDVTEQRLAEKRLRESEEKLSTLFSSMTEMVAMHELVFDKDGKPIDYRLIDCNESFTKITGVKKTDAIGKLSTEVFGLENAPYLDEYSKVAINGESYEFTTYFEPMDKYFLISVVSPEKNHFATITNDITDIQRIQQQVIEKNKELENYLYVASHDLRSPLVNIQGFSQRLVKQTNQIKNELNNCNLSEVVKLNIDKIADEGMPKTLNYILSNVSKMDNLINSLLQISRTGRLLLNIKQVKMNELFNRIVESHNFQITEISAYVNVQKVDDCYGDENQLNQLFSNIIDNALKYHDPERKMQLSISSYAQFNKIIYVIADTGIGIKPNSIEKIWDVFYRTDYATAIKGEGIGLSIAKRIVNKHNGKIWVDSEFGKGSKFYIELQNNEFVEL